MSLGLAMREAAARVRRAVGAILRGLRPDAKAAQEPRDDDTVFQPSRARTRVEPADDDKPT